MERYRNGPRRAGAQGTVSSSGSSQRRKGGGGASTSTGPAVVVVKPDPWKAHCEEAVQALESELLTVKDWPADRYNHRQRMLLQRTVKVINDCKVLGGWTAFKHSQRVAAWMAEVTRYRGCPNGELDMSVFHKPPFTGGEASTIHPTTKVSAPKTSSAPPLTLKREQLDSDALGTLHCGAALGVLDRELLSVKDWIPGEYNLRKHKLIEKTVQVTNECEAYGGWAKYNRSIRIEAWMAEIARYRASPTAELDMSIFTKPPFTDEPISKEDAEEEPLPTPPRTPSVSPLKSAMKRRASDGCLQVNNGADGTPAKRLRMAVTTPSSAQGRSQAKPHRPLLGRVAFSLPSKERRAAKSNHTPASIPLSTEAEAVRTQATTTTPPSKTSSVRTRSRVKFILPETGTPTSDKPIVAGDARSVERIREDQKERRAASKAALDDVPKLREENAELRTTVMDLVNAVKTQAGIIQGMQEENAKFKESVNAKIDRVVETAEADRARVVTLEGRVAELEGVNEELETQNRQPLVGGGTVSPAAIVQVVEAALKTHCETMNGQIVDVLKEFKGQLRGLRDSLQLQQEGLNQGRVLRSHA